MNTPKEKRYGSHCLQIEEPDTLVLRVQGVIDDENAIALMLAQKAFSEGKRYVLLLGDITHMQGMTAGARRVFSEEGRKGVPRGLIAFGASFRGRVIVDLLFRASNLFESGRNYQRLVENEAQARACLDEIRRRFTGRGAGASLG